MCPVSIHWLTYCLMSDTGSFGSRPSRRRILRDLLVFQVKLWLEGLKDIVLVPLSLGAAVIDVIFHRKSGRGALYGVMDLGDRFEEWIDLYGDRPDAGEPVDVSRYAEGYPFRDAPSVEVEGETREGVPESSSTHSRRREKG